MARVVRRRVPHDRTTSRVILAGGERGFTLIELLIAVAVFAVVAVTVYTRSGDTIRQLEALEERTLAVWLAENELAMLRISRANDDAPIPTGNVAHQVAMGGREWRIEVRTSDTTSPLLRRMDVTVARSDAPTTPLETMTGFIGRY
jgi:general secretion pathway protein I